VRSFAHFCPKVVNVFSPIWIARRFLVQCHEDQQLVMREFVEVRLRLLGMDRATIGSARLSPCSFTTRSLIRIRVSTVRGSDLRASRDSR